MNTNLFRPLTIFLIFAFFVVTTFGQELVCKKSALTALRLLPKLEYQCNKNLNEYEEKVLTQKNRLSAINLYLKSLESMTFANWWQASVDDLNMCSIHRKVGKLTEEEAADMEVVDLFGDSKIRVLRIDDPCYQTGYGGSNIFLLNRKNGKVFAAQIIDGYFSRADAIFVDFAMNGTEKITEVATSSGGLNPTVTNYYFTIDKKTNRAIPKNLFLDENQKPTNQITSEMLLEEAEAYDLPENGEDPLQVIKNGRLVKSFEVYVDNGETFGEDKHKKLSKLTLHWNGKLYH